MRCCVSFSRTLCKKKRWEWKHLHYKKKKMLQIKLMWRNLNILTCSCWSCHSATETYYLCFSGNISGHSAASTHSLMTNVTQTEQNTKWSQIRTSSVKPETERTDQSQTGHLTFCSAFFDSRPKSLLRSRSAPAYECVCVCVCVCVWRGEFDTCCEALWAFSKRGKQLQKSIYRITGYIQQYTWSVKDGAKRPRPKIHFF